MNEDRNGSSAQTEPENEIQADPGAHAPSETEATPSGAQTPDAPGDGRPQTAEPPETSEQGPPAPVRRGIPLSIEMRQAEEAEILQELKQEAAAAGKKEFLPQSAAPRSARAPMRKWWLKTAFLLVLIGISVAIMFGIGNFLAEEGTRQVGFAELLQIINYPLFLLLLGVVLLYMVVESSKYAYLLKVYTGKFRLRVAVKTMFLGKYYDGVTPFSSGGQPFQIFYLYKKHDIPKGAAAAIPLARLVVSLTVWCIFALILMCFAPDFLHESGNVTVNRTIQIVAWISVFVNLCFPFLLGALAFFPRAVMKVTALIVRVLWKLRIVKRKELVMKKYVRIVSDYSASMRLIFKKVHLLIPLMLICLVESLITASMPFFVVAAVADIPMTGTLYLQILCLNVISQFSAYLIPTPGNTGAVETTTSFIFITVSGIDHVVGWVILVWRFLTFYLYILSGIGINIFEIIRSAVRTKRERTAD